MYRWWTVLWWREPGEVGLKLGPVTVARHDGLHWIGVDKWFWFVGFCGRWILLDTYRARLRRG